MPKAVLMRKWTAFGHKGGGVQSPNSQCLSKSKHPPSFVRVDHFEWIVNIHLMTCLDKMFSNRWCWVSPITINWIWRIDLIFKPFGYVFSNSGFQHSLCPPDVRMWTECAKCFPGINYTKTKMFDKTIHHRLPFSF